ncbi:lantibiotic dehydratase [Staphylococcus aureus]
MSFLNQHIGKLTRWYYLKNEEWDQQFLKYQEQFNIPNIVNLVYGDNKLLLNLSLANHRYLLMKEYKKHKRVRLVESFLPQ